MLDGLLPEALGDALGDVVAEMCREWSREAERIAAEARAAIAQSQVAVAEARAEVSTLKLQMHEMVVERLATLRDGEPGVPGHNGADADPALIAELVAVEVAKLPPAPPGKNVDPEQVRALVVEEVGHAVESLPPPADGHTPTEQELAPLCEAAVLRAIEALPKPKDGEPGKSVDLEEVERLIAEAVAKLPPAQPGKSITPVDVADMIATEVKAAVDALPVPKDGKSVDPAEIERMVSEAVAKLPPPERGVEGPPGKFSGLEPWSRGIHYESVIVTHVGSTYCAARDTAEEPPHEDWILVAARGLDAPVGEVRGLHDSAAQYRKFDLVSFNGAEWRAKHDDPGPLPGEGWAMSAKQGKRGEPGPRGIDGKGAPGLPGPSGPRIVDWQVDGYRAVPVMSDGETGPPLDMREFFEMYHAEAR